MVSGTLESRSIPPRTGGFDITTGGLQSMSDWEAKTTYVSYTKLIALVKFLLLLKSVLVTTYELVLLDLLLFTKLLM